MNQPQTQEYPETFNNYINLVNGDVIPCCLDQNACVKLGNTNSTQIEDILNSKRVKDIQKGFKNNILVEELCQKCEYRTRFDK